MVLLASFLLVLPPLAIAPNVRGHHASAVQPIRDVLVNGVPLPPAWVGKMWLIGPPLHDWWQSLAARGGRSSACGARLVQGLAHRGGPELGRRGRSAGPRARDLAFRVSRRRGRRAGTGGHGISPTSCRSAVSTPRWRDCRRSSARWTNFATWSRRCTGPASKSFSTSCSTTPQKVTSAGRRSAFADWTTPLTTSSRTTARATPTTPAPGTP